MSHICTHYNHIKHLYRQQIRLTPDYGIEYMYVVHVCRIWRSVVKLYMKHDIHRDLSPALFWAPSYDWGRDNMAAISQTTFSNAFSWKKTDEFRLRFDGSLFLRVQSTIFRHWFRWWIGADQATSHYLNQCWLDYRRIYALLGLNELTENHHWMQCYVCSN